MTHIEGLVVVGESNSLCHLGQSEVPDPQKREARRFVRVSFTVL